MTDHFTLAEFTRSDLARIHKIDNALPPSLLNNARLTLMGAERIRSALGDRPIILLSGYRNLVVNKLAKGTPDSQHVKAQAIDFHCPSFGTPLEVCLHLAPMIEALRIDQLIWEGGWIHASFTLKPRHEILTARKGLFIAGLPDQDAANAGSSKMS